MSGTMDDAIVGLLEQIAPIELQSISHEHIEAIIAAAQEGRDVETEAGRGGFGFGAEVLLEPVVLGVHVALAVVHSVMLLKHRHDEKEMMDRLNTVVTALDQRIELTDALMAKLMEIGSDQADRA